MSEGERFEIQIRETREIVRRMDHQIDLVERLLAEAETSIRVVHCDFTNSIGMELVWCPPGTFWMGSPEDEEGSEDDETLHEVTLTRGFWIGKYPVTQGEFEQVMKSNPSEGWQQPRFPVQNITFNEAVDFCLALGELDGRRHKYYLPTEAQWEYACRAGSKSAWCFGDDETKLTEYAWYIDNCPLVDPPEVGGKRPNNWGIHDMHGLVLEMCADDYGEYPNHPVVDPTGVPKEFSDGYGVSRGGWWFFSGADQCRSATRSKFDLCESEAYESCCYRSLDLGFRVVLHI